MTEYYKYRIRCQTENNWQEWILPSTSPLPNKCPNDSSHIINETLTSVTGTIQENIVKIKEEEIPTGGHFGVKDLDITTNPNSSNTYKISWPYPVNASILKFTTNDAMLGDQISLSIGENTIIGILTKSTISTIPTYDDNTNYNTDDIVEYFDGENIRYFTAIKSVTGVIPTNTDGWQDGYLLTVTETVTTYLKSGFSVAIGNSNLGETIFVDAINNKIYVSQKPDSDHSPGTPVKMTIHFLNRMKIGYGNFYVIGDGKIGGSYIPKNTQITITYENNSTQTNRLVGFVEYTY